MSDCAAETLRAKESEMPENQHDWRHICTWGRVHTDFCSSCRVVRDVLIPYVPQYQACEARCRRLVRTRVDVSRSRRRTHVGCLKNWKSDARFQRPTDETGRRRTMVDEGHRQLAAKLTATQGMLKTAIQVIEGFRPLTTAVREHLAECPADVVAAYEGIADMVADGEASAGDGAVTPR